MRSEGGFTHNPVTAYEPAYGQRHTCSVGRIRRNFLDFERLPAYLKLVAVIRIAVVVGDGVLAVCVKTAVGHKPVRKP